MKTQNSKNIQSAFYIICDDCKNELRMVEGDVIFGAKFYHKDCWLTRNDTSWKICKYSEFKSEINQREGQKWSFNCIFCDFMR